MVHPKEARTQSARQLDLPEDHHQRRLLGSKLVFGMVIEYGCRKIDHARLHSRRRGTRKRNTELSIKYWYFLIRFFFASFWTEIIWFFSCRGWCASHKGTPEIHLFFEVPSTFTPKKTYSESEEREPFFCRNRKCDRNQSKPWQGCFVWSPASLLWRCVWVWFVFSGSLKGG